MWRRRPAAAALVVLAAVGGAAGCGGGRAGRDAGTSPSTTLAAPATTATRKPALAPPALCRAGRPRVLGRVTDPAMDELSGLARGRRDRQTLFAIEDSGAPPVLWALTARGRVRGTVTLAGAGATDWEDLAAGPGPGGVPSLFAADIGDNDARRPSVQVYRTDEPTAAALAGGTVPAVRLDLRYPDGAHDAEALLVDPLRRELVLITKGFAGGRVYTAPAAPAAASATRTLRKGPRVDVDLVTAADISADGRIVAVRSYSRLVVWHRHGREPLTRTLGRPPDCTAPADLGVEGQGEALALTADGRSAITAPEGRDAPLRRYG